MFLKTGASTNVKERAVHWCLLKAWYRLPSLPSEAAPRKVKFMRISGKLPQKKKTSNHHTECHNIWLVNSKSEINLNIMIKAVLFPKQVPNTLITNKDKCLNLDCATHFWIFPQAKFWLSLLFQRFWANWDPDDSPSKLGPNKLGPWKFLCGKLGPWKIRW